MLRPLYDQLIPYYELIEGRDWQREVRLIASILAKHQLSTVIDLGCGSGYHVRQLTKLGLDAIGIDISKQNIQFARAMAKQQSVITRFIAGSYYRYRPRKRVDAALFLNWSIPTRDDELRRFLFNTRSILRIGGLLIVDFERTSEIAWEDVGKPIVDSWKLKDLRIVRASVGQILSNVLYSRDVYILYPKRVHPIVPNEPARYRAVQSQNLVKVYVDCSYVRFFSIPEIRRFANRSGFRLIANYQLPRNGYKRNYAVLERIS